MDKDESVDQLLERASAARGVPPGVCLDGETLAAWADGSLTSAERTAAETHAADCNRCLAVLATLARTSPPVIPAQKPAWLSIRWLVPLTTAAVAIAAWMIVQPAPMQPASDSRGAAGVVDAIKPAAPAVRPEQEPAPQPLADALEKKAEAPVPSRPDALARSRRPANTAADSATASKRADPAAAAPPPVAEPRPSPPPTPAPPTASVAVTSAAPVPQTADIQERRLSASRGAADSLMIVSPDPDLRWRIVSPAVERSIDGGRTWVAQPTGTDGELLAGAAPAPDVCWIVGRSGLVLLSTDGLTWSRLAFPDANAHLSSVSARDASVATVTAADGRIYRTTDGGQTWSVQENPAAPF